MICSRLEPLTNGLRDLEQSVRRPARNRRRDDVFRYAFKLGHAVKPIEPGFETAQCLLHALLKVAANGHHFTHRLHRGGEQWFGAFELFKGKPRDLGDDIVNRRLKARRGRAGDLVGDFIQRVAHRKLRSDARNRKSGRLGSQRR